jgi:hypothetical protein
MSKNRDFLVEIGLEESIVFENPNYDDAIIGYDEITQRVVYDYEKMIECLINEDGMEYDEAIDFIDYNTIRACPYMGDKAPIVLRKID